MDLSKEKLEELMKRLPPENKPQCDLSPFKEISNPSREDKRPECTSCGEIIDSDSAFCKYCGTKIEGQ